MDIDRVISVYFGQTGAAKRVATAISSVISENVLGLDLCGKESGVSLEKNEVLVCTLPVSGGRLSKMAAERLSSLKGSESPAIAVVICGEGGFGDALLELFDTLSAQGFCVMAAAAFVGNGGTRPDDGDFSKLVELSSLCARKLEDFCPCRENLGIPGSRPYAEPKLPPRTVGFFSRLFHRKAAEGGRERLEPQWFI